MIVLLWLMCVGQQPGCCLTLPKFTLRHSVTVVLPSGCILRKTCLV